MRAEDLKKIQVGLIVILTAFGLSLIASQKANPNEQLLFGLKRVQEKAFLSTVLNPKEEIEYMRVLLENRLKELSSVVINKKYNYVLSSASRYSTLAGQITDLVIANNLDDLVEPIEKEFEDHYKKLQDLYVFYPKNIPDNVEWKYIQDDYNYLKIYLDKLSKI